MVLAINAKPMYKIIIYGKLNEKNLLKGIFCAPIVDRNSPPAHRGQPAFPLHPFPEVYDNYEN